MTSPDILALGGRQPGQDDPDEPACCGTDEDRIADTADLAAAEFEPWGMLLFSTP
jgi:hypothetical protein